MEVAYSKTQEGHLMPDLAAPMEKEQDIGTWGRRRKTFLKDNRKGLYAVMKTQGTLFSHLAEVNRQAEAMWSRLVESLSIQQSVDGKMKVQDQMLWVGRMNSIRSQATETVLTDLIYC